MFQLNFEGFLRVLQMVRVGKGILCKTMMTSNTLRASSPYIRWSVSSQDYFGPSSQKEQCCQSPEEWGAAGPRNQTSSVGQELHMGGCAGGQGSQLCHLRLQVVS